MQSIAFIQTSYICFSISGRGKVREEIELKVSNYSLGPSKWKACLCCPSLTLIHTSTVKPWANRCLTHSARSLYIPQEENYLLPASILHKSLITTISHKCTLCYQKSKNEQTNIQTKKRTPKQKANKRFRGKEQNYVKCSGLRKAPSELPLPQV